MSLYKPHLRSIPDYSLRTEDAGMSRQDTLRNGSTPCAYSNCTKTVWGDADGVYSMYCGSSHRMVEDDLCQFVTA